MNVFVTTSMVLLLIGTGICAVRPPFLHFGNDLCNRAFKAEEKNITSCSPLGIRLLLSHIMLSTDHDETKFDLKQHLKMTAHSDKQIENNLEFAHGFIQDEHAESNGLHLREFVSRHQDDGVVWQNIIRMQCKLGGDYRGEKWGKNWNKITGTFMHGEIKEFQSQFIRISCENLKNTHLYFVIPTGTQHLDELSDQMSKHSVENFYKNGRNKKIVITMPKNYKFHSHLNLTPYLQEMGIHKIFTVDKIKEISQTINLEISSQYTTNSSVNDTPQENININGSFYIIADFPPDTLFITKIKSPEKDTIGGKQEIEKKLEKIVNCEDSLSCNDDEICVNRTCKKVCHLGTCAVHAICVGVNHRSVCKCPLGYTGDPRVDGCEKL